jgi:catechol 2,3-dioxygenase-like lactoylglutathione lyase family enzyme
MTGSPGIPLRLHHNAYVSSNLEATRHFYEDLIGMPLTATWCEKDMLFGAERVYCHLFFGLADGSALAFFQFANPEDQALFGPALTSSPFRHIALKVDAETQDKIAGRLAEAGYEPPATYVLEHGYCRSFYVTDPDGLILEFTVDAPEVSAGDAERQANAHAELKRWLAGDHHSNNTFRPAN